MYSEVQEGRDLDENFFEDMFSESIALSGLQGVHKDIIMVKLKEAADADLLNVDFDDPVLKQASVVMVDLTEKGKSAVKDATMTALVGHFQRVINVINKD